MAAEAARGGERREVGARSAADPDQKGLPPGFDALAASKKAEAEKKAAAKVGSGSAKKKR